MKALAMNPFRVGGIVKGRFFTDRAAEIRRIDEALREPGARLLVSGRRRMGKTSAIQAAVRKADRAGAIVLVADLSTTGTAADAANRLLDAAARTMGRQWKDVLADIVQGIGLRLTLSPDPSGLLLPALDVSLRSASNDVQGEALGLVLDAIDALARERDTPVAIVLDEFQEIHRFGGEAAEWQLRGRMQNHEHVSYVLAGSQTDLIERMLDRNRAFYQMLVLLDFGPIDRQHLVRWIDDRLKGAGVDPRPAGTGALIHALAAPRTQDVIRLAHETYEVARPLGAAGPEEVAEAFRQIVAGGASLARALWDRLSPLQQDVLRAVAWGGAGLTTSETIARFSLGSSGSATNAARALLESELLVRSEGGTGYAFDSPFVRGWIIQQTLPDVGIHLDLTHLPGSEPELPPLPSFRAGKPLVDIADRNALHEAMEEDD